MDDDFEPVTISPVIRLAGLVLCGVSCVAVWFSVQSGEMLKSAAMLAFVLILAPPVIVGRMPKWSGLPKEEQRDQTAEHREVAEEDDRLTYLVSMFIVSMVILALIVATFG